MGFALHAACASSKGLICGNHEDNFYFGGKCLEAGNDGLRHPVMLDVRLDGRLGAEAVIQFVDDLRHGGIALSSALIKVVQQDDQAALYDGMCFFRILRHIACAEINLANSREHKLEILHIIV